MMFCLFRWIPLWVASFFMPNTGEIHIAIQSIENAKGSIRFALYDSATSFERSTGAVLGKVIPISQAGTIDITLPDIPLGTYGLAAYHDINNNGKLDKNALGIPKEPYGFSNNPKVKWRAPKFSDMQFSFQQEKILLAIQLKRWKDY